SPTRRSSDLGMFLVANGVSISVLRRRPEIATLRSLGASRAAIFAAFAVEGLAVGAAGTILGEAGGLVLARTALAVVSGTVSDVYAPAARISAAGLGAPVLYAAAAGALSSFLAVLLPAVEATRVDPAPAMRPGSTEAIRRRRLGPRAAAAAAVLVLAALASRAPPVAGRGETVRTWLESSLPADLGVRPASGRAGASVGDRPAEIVSFLQSVPGVSAIDPVRVRDGSDASGRPLTVGSSDFRILSRAGGAPLLDGRDSRKTAEAARRDNQVLVSEPYSRRFGASRGDRLVLATPKGPKSFRIAGVYRDFANDRGTVVLDRSLYLD